MTLLDSLLDAIVRLEGDALVMHVGEKPYVVTTSAAMSQYRGPLAWGQVELSSRVLTSEAVLGMLGQILPPELRQSLDELGAIEQEIPPPAGSPDRFTLVAARGGDDVFLELRRRLHVEAPAAPAQPAVEAQPEEAVAEPPAAEPAPAAELVQPATSDEASGKEIPFEVVPEVLQDAPTDADVDALLAASAAALLGPTGPSAHPDALIVDEQASAPAVPHAEEPEEAEVAAEAEPQLIVAEEQPEPIAAEVEPEPVAAGEPIALAGVDREPVAAEAQAPAVAEEAAPEAIATDVAPEIELEAVGFERAEPPSTAEIEPLVPSAVEGQPVIHENVQPEPIAVESPQTVVVNEEPQPIAQESFPAVSPTAADVQAPLSGRLPEPTPEPVREREPRAVVVPMARPAGRSDAAASPGVQGVSVEALLRLAGARGASTVYVVAQSQPMVRTDGEITALEIGSGAPLTDADVTRLILDLAPPAERDAWQRGTAAEWTFDVEEIGRVRCMTFRDHRGPGLIFRMIGPRTTLADQLGLAPDVRALCTQSDGLVIVTGARASGKSMLMSAFIDLINRTSSDHVITIESQIGFAHGSRRSFVSQREVRGDSGAVAAAVRGALREDPDVLLIEDLRSAEIVSVALEAADSGRLVLGSLPAASTVAAVNRVIEMFTADHRSHALASLAGTLRGVVSQVLLRRSKGGRVAAREILLNTPAVASLIEEGKTSQLPLAMENGRGHGMTPLNDALASLVRDGTVHVTEAYLKASDKEGLLAALKRQGGDTSFAERLA